MNSGKTHPFGRYIRKMREAAGLSQRYVAARLDVCDRYLSQVERGERGPMTPDRCESLARAIPGVNERNLWEMAIASRPARLILGPDHPDHALVLRLAKVINSQGELSPAQRTGIMNILSGSTNHEDSSFPTGPEGNGICQNFSYGTPSGTCCTDRRFFCFECSEMNPEMWDEENGCWRQADDPR